MDAIESSKSLEVENQEKPSARDVQTMEKETIIETIELAISSIQIQLSKKIYIDIVNVQIAKRFYCKLID